jgi:hypothetical protein
MTDDIMNDPEFIEWARRVEREVVPKIAGSAFTISLMPEGPPDIKFAVELGLSVMLDKPIILAVPTGSVVPAKLRALADDIVEVDWEEGSPAVHSIITDAIERQIAKGSK